MRRLTKFSDKISAVQDSWFVYFSEFYAAESARIAQLIRWTRYFPRNREDVYKHGVDLIGAEGIPKHIVEKFGFMFLLFVTQILVVKSEKHFKVLL